MSNLTAKLDKIEEACNSLYSGLDEIIRQVEEVEERMQKIGVNTSLASVNEGVFVFSFKRVKLGDFGDSRNYRYTMNGQTFDSLSRENKIKAWTQLPILLDKIFMTVRELDIKKNQTKDKRF